MEHRCHYVFAAEHPVFVGHFPGNPVVPGVLILDTVRRCLAQCEPTATLTAVTNAKFLAPVGPGQEYEVQLNLDGERLRFRCVLGDALVAEGECMLRRSGTA